MRGSEPGDPGFYRLRSECGTYLGQCYVGELLEGEAVLLPAVALPLPLQDAARGHGGHAHAVTHEQNDVLGVTIGGTSGVEDVLDVSLGLGVPEVPVWGRKTRTLRLQNGSGKNAN